MNTDKISDSGTLTLPTELLFPVFANRIEHHVGVGRLFERLAEFGFVQELRDVGERVEVFLELSLRHEKEHDELHRLIVECVEVDAFGRAAERADDFKNQIGRGVRDADAEADACGHGCFALLDGGGYGVAVAGLNLAGGHEIADEFVNRFPAVRRFQIGDDLRFA
jgi:hypothetical protein